MDMMLGCRVAAACGEGPGVVLLWQPSQTRGCPRSTVRAARATAARVLLVSPVYVAEASARANAVPPAVVATPALNS